VDAKVLFFIEMLQYIEEFHGFSRKTEDGRFLRLPSWEGLGVGSSAWLCELICENLREMSFLLSISTGYSGSKISLQIFTQSW